MPGTSTARGSRSLGGARLQLGIAADRDFGAVLAEGWLGLEPHEVDRAPLLDLLGELLSLIGGGAERMRGRGQ